MQLDHWILEDGKPKKVDLLTWARWFETDSRHVALTEIRDSRISTVFLGIDHGWHSDIPILWETMVFGGPMDGAQTRCGFEMEQAQRMHAQMVEEVRKSYVWWRRLFRWLTRKSV